MRGIFIALWLILIGSALLISSSEVGAAWSGRPCGDTSGPEGTDVPCSCGDDVTTSTRLDATDPVLSTVCPEHGLRIFVAERLVLEINGTLRGTGRGIGLVVLFSDSITVRGGRISGFQTDVYAIDNTRTTFSRLHVIGNASIGINLDENRSTLVERSTVRDNGGAGIRLNLQVSALRNRVEGNGGPGILASSDTAEGPGGLTAGNVVVRNGQEGILVRCLRCRVEKNLVLHNEGFGIRDISATSSDDLGENTFTGNICSGNGLADSEPRGLCR